MREVFELRQYTLHPGKREALIELFEREFIETQQAAGIRLVGQFRDLDDPDRFVWIRAFPGMVRRKEALTRFYGGPVWKKHRDAANATMIDSDNVLLLRLADSRSEFPATAGPDSTHSPSIVYVTIFSFDAPVELEVVDLLDRELNPMALLQTETAENTFPQLPVRLGENVIVAMTRRPYEAGSISEALSHRFKSAPHQLRLEPTPRSLLR